MSQYVVFTVHQSPNLNSAIAEAVLSKLGLKGTQLRKDFVSSYGYTNLGDFFRERVNAPENAKAYTNIGRELKKHGKVTVSFGVADSLIKDIKEFLAVHDGKFKDRVKDAGKQFNSTVKDAAYGVNKNLASSVKDMDRGAGQAADGLWNSMTAPVGSERFGEGMNDVKDGFLQYETGLLKLEAQTPLDALLTLLGGEADIRQTLYTFENIGRSLNTVEREILQSVFGSSVLLEVIIIKKGVGFYRIGKDKDAQNNTTYFHNTRALTRGNTIYMKDNPVGSPGWNSTLVHETTHVWQNQNGGTDYISEALYAQTFGDGYDYQKGISQGKSWAMLNPEQQAKLVEVAYTGGFFKTSYFVDEFGASRPDLAKYMQNVLPQLRTGQGAT